MTLLKSLFNIVARQFGGPASERPLPAAEPVPRVVRARRVFLGWEAAIDGQGRIAGYLLRPRVPGTGSVTGHALAEALADEDLERFAGRLVLMVQVSAAQWQSGELAALAAPHVVFYIDDYENLDAAARSGLLADFRAAGTCLALPAISAADAGVFAARPAALVWNFQRTPMQQIEASVRSVRTALPETRRVAVEVETWAEQRLAAGLGFDWCCGGFATMPEEHADSTGRLGKSRLVVIEMLSQLRANAALSGIVAVAKRDPVLVVRLLELANSPLYGLNREVSSLDEAIQLLGREPLYRWLALALFKVGDGGRDRDRTLLVLALSRAQFLEALLRQRDPKLAEELFLLGLFSVLDGLLGEPFPRLLQRMRLAEPIANALLHREGPLAPYLDVVAAMERCQLDRALTRAATLEIDAQAVLDAYAVAVSGACTELVAE